MKRNKKKINKKNIIILIAVVLLIYDFISIINYVGYKTNFVPIAVLAYGLYRINDRTDKQSRLISLILISSSIILMCYTFTSKNYLTVNLNHRKVKVQIPSKTKLIEDNKNEFRLKLKNPKTKTINKYLEKLEQQTCNSSFYYDKKQNISIGGLNSILDEEIILVVTEGNYCEEKTNGIKYKTYKNYKTIDELSPTYEISKFIKDGYVVYNNNLISNKESYESFFEKVNKKEEAFVRIITIDNEEFIISDITFRDGKYIIESSNKRSKFSGSKQTIYKTFDSLEYKQDYIYAVSQNDIQKIAKIINY